MITAVTATAGLLLAGCGTRTASGAVREGATPAAKLWDDAGLIRAAKRLLHVRPGRRPWM